jgi:hypothetical protein
MGLGNLIDGGDDDDESDSNTSGSSSSTSSTEPKKENQSKRKYERITYDEFRDFLDDLRYGFYENDDVEGGERVFESEGLMPFDDDVILRIYSTIPKHGQGARDRGDDAIRTVVWSREEERPIGGRTKTLRIQTWRKNLREKIESIMEETQQYVTECPVCLTYPFTRDHGFLVEKSGKYGPIVGCTNYPECSVMLTSTKNDKFKVRESQNSEWMYADTEQKVLEKLREKVD